MSPVLSSASIILKLVYAHASKVYAAVLLRSVLQGGYYSFCDLLQGSAPSALRPTAAERAAPASRSRFGSGTRSRAWGWPCLHVVAATARAPRRLRLGVVRPTCCGLPCLTTPQHDPLFPSYTPTHYLGPSLLNQGRGKGSSSSDTWILPPSPATATTDTAAAPQVPASPLPQTPQLLRLPPRCLLRPCCSSTGTLLPLPLPPAPPRYRPCLPMVAHNLQDRQNSRDLLAGAAHLVGVSGTHRPGGGVPKGGGFDYYRDRGGSGFKGLHDQVVRKPDQEW